MSQTKMSPLSCGHQYSADGPDWDVAEQATGKKIGTENTPTSGQTVESGGTGHLGLLREEFTLLRRLCLGVACSLSG